MAVLSNSFARSTDLFLSQLPRRLSHCTPDTWRWSLEDHLEQSLITWPQSELLMDLQESIFLHQLNFRHYKLR